MDFLPWRGGSDGREAAGASAGEPDAIVSCEFQDGSISVFEDRIDIRRASASKFDDKSIPVADIEDVTYERRLVISYLQIEQTGFENDATGLLSTPVDENTLHFGRGMRDCASRARDAIVERLTTTQSDDEFTTDTPAD